VALAQQAPPVVCRSVLIGRRRHTRLPCCRRTAAVARISCTLPWWLDKAQQGAARAAGCKPGARHARGVRPAASGPPPRIPATLEGRSSRRSQPTRSPRTIRYDPLGRHVPTRTHIRLEGLFIRGSAGLHRMRRQSAFGCAAPTPPPGWVPRRTRLPQPAPQPASSSRCPEATGSTKKQSGDSDGMGRQQQ